MKCVQIIGVNPFFEATKQQLKGETWKCIDAIVVCWMPGVFGRMLTVGGGCTSKTKLMSVTMWEKNMAVCISQGVVLWMKCFSFFFSFPFCLWLQIKRKKGILLGGGQGGLFIHFLWNLNFFPVLFFPSHSNCLPWLHTLFHIVLVCLQMCICSTAINFFF